MPRSDYLYTSESFALAQIKQYWQFYSNRISNTDPAHSKYSAYASSTSPMRTPTVARFQRGSRVSGKTDAVRLPKEAYFAEQVMQTRSPTSTSSGTGRTGHAARRLQDGEDDVRRRQQRGQR